MTALLPPPPYELLLRKIADTINAVDLPGLSGIPGLHLRHARNRNPEREEMPCLSLVFAGDSPGDEREQFLSDWEQLRFLDFDIQVDVDLPPEDRQDPALADVTGILTPGRALAAATWALYQHGVLIGPWCLGINSGAVDPDESSKPDKARLVRKHVMQYRVRTDDPNVLLATGAIEP